jgi:NAD(P)-dependent dehydrogenase (short-subunit alcohol dehydrogenase family)
MLARNAEKLQEVEGVLAADGITSTSYAVDIADRAAYTAVIHKIAAEHPDVDLLHYNPSAYNPANPSVLDLKVFDSDMQINVTGGIIAVQAFWPLMLKRGHGVVFFTGGGSAFKAPPELTSLSMGKAAMRNYALTLALEGKPLGIHVGTVTVCGPVKPGTRFDPDLVANHFWDMYRQKDAGTWTTEIVMD